MEAPDGKLLDLDSITSSQLARHVRHVIYACVPTTSAIMQMLYNVINISST